MGKELIGGRKLDRWDKLDKLATRRRLWKKKAKARSRAPGKAEMKESGEKKILVIEQTRR